MITADRGTVYVCNILVNVISLRNCVRVRLKVHSDVWPLLMSSSLHQGPTGSLQLSQAQSKITPDIIENGGVVVVEKQHEY